eukprot:6588510-Pyramimonas_sp.AAC.1
MFVRNDEDEDDEDEDEKYQLLNEAGRRSRKLRPLLAAMQAALDRLDALIHSSASSSSALLAGAPPFSASSADRRRPFSSPGASTSRATKEQPAGGSKGAPPAQPSHPSVPSECDGIRP